jgi:hypothetical protein
MNKFTIAVITFAIGAAFSTGASAESMSKKEYDANKNKLGMEYDAAKAKCDTLAGNPKDICVAEAKGALNTAKADLFAVYQPTSKTRQEASVVKAESARAVAKQKCDAVTGNARDVCNKQADAAETAAKGNADVIRKTFDANATADQKAAEAREEAALDKLEARYETAKERCDAFCRRPQVGVPGRREVHLRQVLMSLRRGGSAVAPRQSPCSNTPRRPAGRTPRARRTYHGGEAMNTYSRWAAATVTAFALLGLDRLRRHVGAGQGHCRRRRGRRRGRRRPDRRQRAWERSVAPRSAASSATR